MPGGIQNLQGLIGIAVVLLIAWAFSENRSGRPSWRWIAGALAMQFALAVIVTRVPFVWTIIGYANNAVSAIETATLVGSSYMFGYTGGAPIPFVLKSGAEEPVIVAFQILPLIIVFSAIAALLWHWGILRAAVRGLSWAMQKTLGVSGVVGFGAGSTMFLGVVESPLVLKAWFAKMSRSDLFAIMVLIMSTISGAILVLYATTLSKTLPNAVGHMIVASLISLPAAVLVAKIMIPPESIVTDEPRDENDDKRNEEASLNADPGLRYESSMDAVIRGTAEGVSLVLAVLGIIIVVFALVSLSDQLLVLLPAMDGAPITLKRIFGWIFSPAMWAIGVPWDQAPAAGGLMGTKAVFNEYVAYLELAALPESTFDPRSLLIVTYSLCGVANLASVGLIVSTVGTVSPERRSDVAKLGMKAWLAGNMVSLMTGAVIGVVTWS